MSQVPSEAHGEAPAEAHKPLLQHLLASYVFSSRCTGVEVPAKDANAMR